MKKNSIDIYPMFYRIIAIVCTIFMMAFLALFIVLEIDSSIDLLGIIIFSLATILGIVFFFQTFSKLIYEDGKLIKKTIVGRKEIPVSDVAKVVFFNAGFLSEYHILLKDGKKIKIGFKGKETEDFIKLFYSESEETIVTSFGTYSNQMTNTNNQKSRMAYYNPIVLVIAMVFTVLTGFILGRTFVRGEITDTSIPYLIVAGICAIISILIIVFGKTIISKEGESIVKSQFFIRKVKAISDIDRIEIVENGMKCQYQIYFRGDKESSWKVVYNSMSENLIKSFYTGEIKNTKK